MVVDQNTGYIYVVYGISTALGNLTTGTPPFGQPQAHSLTQVNTTGPNGGTAQDTYGYDATGNTTTRDVGGDKAGQVYGDRDAQEQQLPRRAAC